VLKLNVSQECHDVVNSPSIDRALALLLLLLFLLRLLPFSFAGGLQEKRGEALRARINFPGLIHRAVKAEDVQTLEHHVKVTLFQPALQRRDVRLECGNKDRIVF
jgi:hypothetical protein